MKTLLLLLTSLMTLGNTAFAATPPVVLCGIAHSSYIFNKGFEEAAEDLNKKIVTLDSNTQQTLVISKPDISQSETKNGPEQLYSYSICVSVSFK
ncbi:MAG: hypothetical protein AB7F59_14920 [Bdellovibrionales bacterium]